MELTADGRRHVRDLPHPEALAAVGMVSIYEYVEQAIKVGREFFRDRQYVVRDGEIVIVDEFTGRLSEGRKWRAGIEKVLEPVWFRWPTPLPFSGSSQLQFSLFLIFCF